MPWIKVWTDILDDPKIGRLSAADRWQFMALCVLAGECDAEGYLANGDAPLFIDDIAWRLRERTDDMIASMERLSDAGLLCQDDDGSWFVTNFSKRQGRPQYEKRRQWRERKQRQREQSPEEPGLQAEPVDESAECPAECPASVPRESRENHGLRDRDRDRVEKETEIECAASAASGDSQGLTDGQRYFLTAFGAKRFRTVAQKAAILALERDFGTDTLQHGVDWAAKQGMNMGKAVISLETALPKWGKPKQADTIKVAGL
jgi:hypothetical protein